MFKAWIFMSVFSFVAQVAGADFLQKIPLPGRNACLFGMTELKSGALLAVGIDYIASDALLMRTNDSGRILSTKRVSGFARDQASSVSATSDGGSVIVGITESFVAGQSDG